MADVRASSTPCEKEVARLEAEIEHLRAEAKEYVLMLESQQKVKAAVLLATAKRIDAGNKFGHPSVAAIADDLRRAAEGVKDAE